MQTQALLGDGQACPRPHLRLHLLLPRRCARHPPHHHLHLAVEGFLQFYMPSFNFLVVENCDGHPPHHYLHLAVEGFLQFYMSSFNFFVVVIAQLMSILYIWL